LKLDRDWGGNADGGTAAELTVLIVTPALDIILSQGAGVARARC